MQVLGCPKAREPRSKRPSWDSRAPAPKVGKLQARWPKWVAHLDGHLDERLDVEFILVMVLGSFQRLPNATTIINNWTAHLDGHLDEHLDVEFIMVMVLGSASKRFPNAITIMNSASTLDVHPNVHLDVQFTLVIELGFFLIFCSLEEALGKVSAASNLAQDWIQSSAKGSAKALGMGGGCSKKDLDSPVVRCCFSPPSVRNVQGHHSSTSVDFPSCFWEI